MTKIVNLFGGPGIGKSTTAAALFAKMKNAGHRVELVTEYAKDLTYACERNRLDNQLHVLAEQDLRQRRLLGQVDYVITDSPLLLATIYAKAPFNSGWFIDAAIRLFLSYDNFNALLWREKPFAAYGRLHGEEEARCLDIRIEDIIYATCGADAVFRPRRGHAVEDIYKEIMCK